MRPIIARGTNLCEKAVLVQTGHQGGRGQRKKLPCENERRGTNQVPAVFDTSRQTTRGEAEAERRRKGVDRDEANSNRNMRILGFPRSGYVLCTPGRFFLNSLDN